MSEEDDAFLEAAQAGTAWLRSVLCTLARRGVAFRRGHPDRARRVVEHLSTSPLYRGGQFAFDLLELEDLMLDGPPPDAVSTTLDRRALLRLAAAVRRFQRGLDGTVPPAADEAALAEAARLLGDDGSDVSSEEEDLPELEASFHLYTDVVLGVVRSAAPLLLERRRRPGA